MDYDTLMDYSNDTVDVNLDQYIDDGSSLLDEMPDMDRFVSLDDFLKRGEDDYQKWGLE